MAEINVIDSLSGIDFGREPREKVADVLAAVIADRVAQEVGKKVPAEQPADQTASEPAQVDESKRRKKSPTS